MVSINRIHQRYDHRLRDLVRSSGNINYAIALGIPRSTAHGWLTSNPVEIVTLDVFDMDLLRLQKEVLILRRRIKWIIALFRLLVALMKVSGFSLENSRLPEGAQKARLLRAIELSLSVLPLPVALRLLRLSPSRYHSWKNDDKECGLDDISSCPRSSPQQLTRNEVNTIEEMVTSEAYRHVPTSRLAILAQRLGKVFASPATWFRLVRLHKWRRPRRRIHPAKPKVGIRAIIPNEIWHVDTTLIRLLDGSRAYLHSVIDNFSRRILSWKVSGIFDPSITAELLLDASKGLFKQQPMLLADGGVENFNSAVDELVSSGLLRRLLAQTDISYSNSLIESWWRSLKHQWLFLNTLDTISAVKKLVSFYVEQHNTHLPHSAFSGQTPDEMYFGTGAHIPDELNTAKKQALESRMAINRSVSCPICEPLAWSNN
ncbi:transposase [Planctomycetota bacterium]